MRSLFSVGRNSSIVLITLLAILILGALYFFVYVPDNETRIEAQRYRSLQNVERNIHAKVENSAGLLNNLLVAYAKDKGKTNLSKYSRLFFYSKQFFYVPGFYSNSQ